MKDMSVLFTELIESADCPVGSLPDVTPLESATRTYTCDICECRISRCSGTRCCL